MRKLVYLSAILIVAVACADKERSYVPNIIDGENSPTMTTYDVNTFISDSGYTRYHITTPVWRMYEDAREPFWRFPDGLEMQQFDTELRPDASMICDSAVYFSRKRLWRLDGHVMMVNTARDTFLSQQLFWDQARRTVYTDSFIHIVRSDRTIEGYGFESNENMTAYTVNRPTAIIPADSRHRQQSEVEPTDSTSTDSVIVMPHRRQAPQRPQVAPGQLPKPQEPKSDQRFGIHRQTKL